MKPQLFIKKIVSYVLMLALVICLVPTSSVYAATDDLTSYSPELFSFNSEEDLMAKIIQNDDFVYEHAMLGHLLGFGWCGGTGSQYVGEDFEFKRLGDGKFSLKARYNSNDPYAGGYWADKRLEMIFDNVKLYIDGETLDFGTHKITSLEPVTAYTADVENNGATAITRYPRLNYTTNSSWSRTDEYSFGQSLGIKNKYKFDIGIMGSETEISIGLDFSQGWSTTEGTSESISYEERLEVPLEPYTKRHVSFVMLKDKADIPYTANMYIEYDVTYKGFLRWSGNAHGTHPDNRPMVEKTFGNSERNAAEDLYEQYIHRDINGFSEWDWQWIINQGDGDSLKYVLSGICKGPRGGIMRGTFKGVSGAVCKGEVGPVVNLDPPAPLALKQIDPALELDEDTKSDRVERSLSDDIILTNETYYDVPNVDIERIIID